MGKFCVKYFVEYFLWAQLSSCQQQVIGLSSFFLIIIGIVATTKLTLGH